MTGALIEDGARYRMRSVCPTCEAVQYGFRPLTTAVGVKRKDHALTGGAAVARGAVEDAVRIVALNPYGRIAVGAAGKVIEVAEFGPAAHVADLENRAVTVDPARARHAINRAVAADGEIERIAAVVAGEGVLHGFIPDAAGFGEQKHRSHIRAAAEIGAANQGSRIRSGA